MQEAVARGQLAFPDQRFPNKKRRLDGERLYVPGRGNMRGQSRGRGRGGMYAQRMRDTREVPHTTSMQGPDTPVTQPHDVTHPPDDTKLEDGTVDDDTSGSDSDSDAPPEVVSSKVTGGRQEEIMNIDDGIEHKQTAPKAIRKPQPKQPRRPPQNPFASRPALLRNVSNMSVLSPEISHLVIASFT